MADELLNTIGAGNTPLYELLQTETGSLILRNAANPDERVELLPSCLPMVIRALSRACKELGGDLP